MNNCKLFNSEAIAAATEIVYGEAAALTKVIEAIDVSTPISDVGPLQAIPMDVRGINADIWTWTDSKL